MRAAVSSGDELKLIVDHGIDDGVFTLADQFCALVAAPFHEPIRRRMSVCCSRMLCLVSSN